MLFIAAFAVLASARPGAGPRPAQGGGACFLPLIMGDLSGNRGVWADDALYLLRLNAGLFVPEPACSPADVDCSGSRNAVDALKILRHVALIEVQQNEPCVPIGDEIPP